MTQASSSALGSSGSGPYTAGLVFDQSVPACDPLKLMALAHDTGEIAAQRFLDEYLGLLRERQDHILAGLTYGEAERTMDAILSLKVTSSMVGAVRLRRGPVKQLLPAPAGPD